MADRTAIGRRGRPADHLLPARRHLLAALREGLVTMVNSIYNGYRMEDVWIAHVTDRLLPVCA